jgi:RsiW-degrading membrane proteinase PrsW (M82 family)
MGISIVASFVDPSEAQVACGALRSAGFHAMVLDQTFATMDWIAMQALGGIRVGVPESEIEEASDFLRAIVKDRPERTVRIQSGVSWRVLAILAAALAPILIWIIVRPQFSLRNLVIVAGAFAPTLAWLVVAFAKSRDRQSQVLPAVLVALALIAACAVIFAAGALIGWLPSLFGARGAT